jgi:glycosyltransferase involved in cell wall biosynthesis
VNLFHPKELMIQRPLISILTASLNNGATIRNTLESVRNQTCQDLEHIVIDGGSADDTLSILKQYEEAYNLSSTSENDKGIADALNKGVAKSRGAYLVVIQADDRFLDEGVLKKVFLLLRDEVYDIHSFPVILNHPIHGPIHCNPIRALWWNRFKFIFHHQGTFVHRRVFEKIGGFREQFSIAMDYDLFYRALVAGCSVKFYSKPSVALMGGLGIGTRLDCLTLRLQEEALVQDMNERNPLWRAAQVLFRKLYFPYKTRLFPRLNPSSRKAPSIVSTCSRRRSHEQD